MWDQILTTREDLLCSNMGYSTPPTIHVEPHNVVNIQDGSNKVHIWETNSYRYNLLLENVVIIKWHSICHTKDHQRQCVGGSSCPPISGRLPIIKIWLPKRGYHGHENDENVIGDDEGPEPEERWNLMFDGAFNTMGHGIGAMLMSPKNYHLPFTAKLYFDCTNNITKYEACILGLEASIDSRIKILEVYGDSALVIHRIRGGWEMRHPNLIPYQDYVLKLLPKFEEITFTHIPREENQMEDDLASLVSMYKPIWRITSHLS